MRSKIAIKILLIVGFFLIYIKSQDYKIIETNNNYLIIEYSPIYTDTLIFKNDKSTYTKLGILNTIYENQNGYRKPIRIFPVGVKSINSTTIQILSSEFTILNGELEKDKEEELEKIEYNLIKFGTADISRGMQVQQIEINTIDYDELQKQIKLLKRIRFRIDYNSEGEKFNKVDDGFNNFVINYDFAKNWLKEDKSLKKVNNSILSTGTWYRFEVKDEGIYEISASDLKNYGIDVEKIDVNTIKIFGNGGKSVVENFNLPRIEDLEEIAIDIKYANNKLEKIIFYARGVNFFEYNENLNSGRGDIARNKHYYSEVNYYWITSGGAPGKRMTKINSINTENYFTQNKTIAFHFLDEDKRNISGLGRLYFGDDFNSSQKSRIYTNSLKYIVPNSIVTYSFGLANTTSGIISLVLEENGKQIYNMTLAGASGEFVKGRYTQRKFNYNGGISDEMSFLKFQINNTSNFNAFLDYYEIKYEKYLKAIENELMFFGKDSNAVIEYFMDSFTGSTESAKVYNVTKHNEVFIIENVYKSASVIKFKALEKEYSMPKYFVLTENKYKKPSNPQVVKNSNIRGFVSGVEHIIITNEAFINSANKLKNHRSENGISSSVFDIREIYNEFSGGLTDPLAIRDFLKYAYYNWQIKPKYVLLLGRGSYDILNKHQNNKNIIPTYQTLESLDKIYSFPNDDVYVNVEGIWSGDNFSMDMALGRISVTTIKEAENAIDKIIEYEKNSQKDIWKNRIILVADDATADASWIERFHVEQSENLASRYIPANYDLNKIYLSSYPVTITGSGRRKPEAATALIDAINNEALIVNYFGHGSPSLWAHEHVFEQSTSIPRMNNKNCIFVTVASCDFAWYDDHEKISGAEELVYANNGAIGVFAASRPVYADENASLNYLLYDNLLGKTKEAYGDIGLAITKAKNSFSRTNSRKYVLIGDPAVKLNLPKHEIIIDSVKGKSTNETIQVSALEKISIKGRVIQENQILNNYNGEVIITVYDSEKNVLLQDVSLTMKTQGGVIFRGRASVVNGEFSEEFVVPKDISYENKNGKIVSYSFDNGKRDAIGYTTNIKVGGSSELANDGKGPEISIFFDNENNRTNALVNKDFTLIAKITDETGLNTTGSGIGHKLEAIIDGDQNRVIDLTNFYVGEINSGGRKGELRYKVSEMSEGEHKISVKAWDVFNNMSIAEEYFTVVRDKDNTIENVYNYPNPFRESTTFTFQHNINEPIEAKIKIYTVSGRVIKEIEETGIIERFVRINWDGKDADGSEIANGTYFYKIDIKTLDGNLMRSVIGKLSIIR